MKIKAIALDLDGTLLTSDKKISDINKEVLKYLENKGVKIFIVTGIKNPFLTSSLKKSIEISFICSASFAQSVFTVRLKCFKSTLVTYSITAIILI